MLAYILYINSIFSCLCLQPAYCTLLSFTIRATFSLSFFLKSYFATDSFDVIKGLPTGFTQYFRRHWPRKRLYPYKEKKWNLLMMRDGGRRRGGIGKSIRRDGAQWNHVQLF